MPKSRKIKFFKRDGKVVSQYYLANRVIYTSGTINISAEAFLRRKEVYELDDHSNNYKSKV